MSWAAATEASHTGIKAEVKYLDDWINLLDKLIEEYPEFPWVEIEARVALTINHAHGDRLARARSSQKG